MTPGAFVQIFSEFFPIIAFFIVGVLYPFETAVSILVTTTMLSLVVSMWHLGQIPLLPLVSAAIVTVSGAITIFYDQPDAIILADSIYYFMIAFFIAVGFNRPRHFLERIFDATFAMEKAGWEKLSKNWLIVLVLAGSANEMVRIAMTPEFWVYYRFTKVIIISTFALYQFRISRQYRIIGESNAWGLRTNAKSYPEQ